MKVRSIIGLGAVLLGLAAQPSQAFVVTGALLDCTLEIILSPFITTTEFTSAGKEAVDRAAADAEAYLPGDAEMTPFLRSAIDQIKQAYHQDKNKNPRIKAIMENPDSIAQDRGIAQVLIDYAHAE